MLNFDISINKNLRGYYTWGMKTHKGGCHCGNVRFEIKASLEKVISCNCSICLKRGLLLTFVPKSQFTLTKGEESLTGYRFNTMNIRHLFCKHCGVEAFGMGKSKDGAETVALNVRCIDDIDLNEIEATPYNEKSL